MKYRFGSICLVAIVFLFTAVCSGYCIEVQKPVVNKNVEKVTVVKDELGKNKVLGFADLVAVSVRVVDAGTHQEPAHVETGEAVLIVCSARNDGPAAVTPLVTLTIDGNAVVSGAGASAIQPNQSAEVQSYRYVFQNAGAHTIEFNVSQGHAMNDLNLNNNRVQALVNVVQAGVRLATLTVETRYGTGPRYDQIFQGAQVRVEQNGRLIGQGQTTFRIDLPVGQTFQVSVHLPHNQMQGLGLQPLQLEDQSHEVGIPQEGWVQAFYYQTD